MVDDRAPQWSRVWPWLAAGLIAPILSRIFASGLSPSAADGVAFAATFAVAAGISTRWSNRRSSTFARGLLGAVAGGLTVAVLRYWLR